VKLINCYFWADAFMTLNCRNVHISREGNGYSKRHEGELRGRKAQLSGLCQTIGCSVARGWVL
jgi:hypothetical protein